ncbi:TetR/AcrR family transcriptional regulator [Frankia sp. Cppng1_Ct_nod]|uniref:TetR/AcrR family transcriptional regulator n=1 Tax=Frankia sp. Cppng1_Ct_nod TaxID=2897162 RepID=UPI001040F646|nr:TetR/AcrR family transcriptional regulator [Frankia sp. Cppng1_Ct_nod]
MTESGAPVHRSRQQRTSDSRQRILDAAIACLIEHGYSGTTTLMIQSRADVSRGRLLHHFPSREVLLVAATQHLATSRMHQIGTRVARLSENRDDGADRLDLAVELLWETFHEPYFWAAIEIWTAARTNDNLARALLPEERRLGAAIRETIDTIYGPEVRNHPLYPQVRELLFTSMRGVALTYAFDPRPPATDPHLAQWKNIARRLLDL